MFKNKMPNQLTMEDRHGQTVQQILSKYPYKFYAYGSRVKGNTRRISDLDICYYDDIPSGEIVQLKDEFVESDLPFEVELVSGKRMRPAFQENIQKDLILISPHK